MTLQLELKKTALEQRAKELDAREESLNQREALITKAERKVKNLDQELVLGEQRLEILIQNIERKVAETKQIEENHRQELNELSKQFDNLKSSHASVLAELGVQKEAVKLAKQDLNKVNDEIRERKSYLGEQEHQINATIDNWNADLTLLRHEIEIASGEKAELLRKILTLKDDIEIIVAECARVEDKLLALDARYKETSENYRKSLLDIQGEITTESQKLQVIKQESAKEKSRQEEVKLSIDAKRRALKKEQEELNTAKRRFEAEQRLYS